VKQIVPILAANLRIDTVSASIADTNFGKLIEATKTFISWFRIVEELLQWVSIKLGRQFSFNAGLTVHNWIGSDKYLKIHLVIVKLHNKLTG